MKLYEYKTKYLSILALYKPGSEEEAKLKDVVIRRLYDLRTMTMPYLLTFLYEVINREDVSEEFKKICINMIEDAKLVRARKRK